jgi:hypothetical protein
VSTGKPPSTVPERLQRLLDEGALQALRPDPVSIAGLWLKAVNSDLDAREAGLSMDNRVALAYQAGLQAVHALLDAHGYRVRSGRSHHHYSFYATQALAEAAGDQALRQAAEELDGHRTQRATAVYDAEPATEKDLVAILGILDRLLPAIHTALLKRNPSRAPDLPSPRKRPA